MSGNVVNNTPNRFAEFANEVRNVDCLFLSKGHLLKEPEEVTKGTPIPTTLNIHKVKRVTGGNSFVNKFYYLSENLEPFFTCKYGVQCRHKATDTIVKINMSRLKNGFNALYALSGTMKSASMNRSWTFASSYFVYSVLIFTRGWSDFSCCILFVYTSLSIPFRFHLLDGKKYCRSRAKTINWKAN